jgi:hydrogenase expression/formation protein HypC
MCLAIPGRIEAITNTEPLTRAGRVDFGGVIKEINLAFVPEAEVGDYVIAHVGVAITRLSEAEARRTLESLAEDTP